MMLEYILFDTSRLHRPHCCNSILFRGLRKDENLKSRAHRYFDLNVKEPEEIRLNILIS